MSALRKNGGILEIGKEGKDESLQQQNFDYR